jgi:hypothetical protein
MAEIKPGASVFFLRSHDTQHELTGTVKEVRDEEVLVATDPNGILIWVPADRVKVSGVKRRIVDKPARPETAGEESAREAAEEAEEAAEDVQPTQLVQDEQPDVNQGGAARPHKSRRSA